MELKSPGLVESNTVVATARPLHDFYATVRLSCAQCSVFTDLSPLREDFLAAHHETR